MNDIQILTQHSSYLGFTDNKYSLEKDKIENILDKEKNYMNLIEGEKSTIIARKDFILYLSLTGYIPLHKEMYNKNYKPISIYTMTLENSDVFWEITKTEYNFAIYIQKNNLVLLDKVYEFLENEKKILEKVKREKILNIEKQETIKNKVEEDRNKFNDWILNESQIYADETKLYIQKIINLDLLGHYHPNVKKLLVLIDNIDNPLVREKLSQILNTNNFVSKKTFKYITGINLPKSNKEIKNLISNLGYKNFKNPIEYKPSKKLTDSTKKLCYYSINGKFYETLGESFDIDNINLFITYFDYYSIVEIKTGVLISTGNTKEIAISNFKKNINDFGVENFNKKIEELINEYGLSPYCTQSINLQSKS